MGLFDDYVPSKKLDELSDDVLNKLKRLEKIIKNSKTDETIPVSKVIASHAEEIVGLVDRLSKHLQESPPAWGTIWSNSKFIYGIAVEIYQLIVTIVDEVTDDDMSAEEKKKVLTELGKNLVWLIWSVMDPLRKITWLPAFIERVIVKWIASQALDFAADLLSEKEGRKLKAAPGKKEKAKPGAIKLKVF